MTRQAPTSEKTRRRITKILDLHGWFCYICLVKLTLDTATLDHYIPSGKGGGSKIKNLRPCCVLCNQVKRDRMPTPENPVPLSAEEMQSLEAIIKLNSI